MRSDRAAPTATAERITNLDALRGVAVLGILVMNAVSYGLPSAAYFNLDAAGSNTWADWVVGVAGEIFVDQKTMALFSALFGAGIVLFADRAAEKGRRPVLFSLWRNFLLLLIGLAHAAFWDGDVLVLYASCSVILIATRKLAPRLLFLLGGLAVIGSAAVFTLAQLAVSDSPTELGSFWFVGPETMSDRFFAVLLSDFFLRGIGLMWIGVGLYRTGVLQGHHDDSFYRMLAVRGLGVGLPLAALGVIIQAVADYDPDVAVIGQVPNTLATVPIMLGYIGLISRWNARPSTWLHEHIRACGRMALTNYLSQTALGLIVLRVAFEQGELGRAAIIGFVLAVWVLQVAWSKPWLERFRFGPLEWLWRCATYRRWQPLRR